MPDQPGRDLLTLAFPFGLELQIGRPDEPAIEEVLLRDRPELQLIFIDLRAGHLGDARPARLRVHGHAEAVLRWFDQLIFEFGRGSLKGEVAVDRLELTADAAHVVTGEIGVGRYLEAVG